ncbi:MAG TPA: outer membrane beta-barrel protein [Kofleriaceae bacterium]|nr:outer membrane beta-barrel protein [Kofleriaceae bacterium]
MKRIASLALALLGLAAAAPAAHASSYALLGFGPKAGTGGDLGDSANGDTRTLRAGLGQRIGPVGLEGSLFGADLIGTGGRTFNDGREFWTLSAGLDLKGFFTIVGPIELFGKAGINHTWVQGNELSGTGWDVGAGVQFVLDLPLGYAAVWADFTYQDLGLSDDNIDVDGSLNMVMVGASIGL